MFQLFVVLLSYLFPLCDIYSLEVHMKATLAIVYLISFEEIDPGEPIPILTNYWVFISLIVLRLQTIKETQILACYSQNVW